MTKHLKAIYVTICYINYPGQQQQTTSRYIIKTGNLAAQVSLYFFPP